MSVVHVFSGTLNIMSACISERESGVTNRERVEAVRDLRNRTKSETLVHLWVATHDLRAECQWTE